jgi:periplasmic protein TonB
MSSTHAASSSRHVLVLAAIVGLHVEVFWLVASGLVPRAIKVLAPNPPPIEVVLREKEEVVVVKPDAAPLMEPDYSRVTEPEIPLPDFAESKEVPAAPVLPRAPAEGSGSVIEFRQDYQPPGLRTRDRRLAALVDSCYPAASRRLGEEGRVVARVVVGADGRARGWNVAQSSGFSRLDAALGCVTERIEFVAGRRDGQPVEAEALLPVVFRLD